MSPDPGAFDLGPRDADRPAVLCLHGLAGTPWDVRLPAEHLVRAGFRCHGPVLPGHGTHPGELARTPAGAWLDAALEAFDALAALHTRVYVLGLSMGGVLSLALCQRRAPRGAVLLAVPIRLPARVRVPVALLRRWIESVRRLPGALDPHARAENPGYLRMPLAAVHGLVALQTEVRAGLGRIRQPLLLGYGARDRTASPENADWIRRGVSSQRVELRRFERSGHLLTVDFERDQVARASGDFLVALEASRD